MKLNLFQKLFHHVLGKFGLLVMAFWAFAAIFAYSISLDKTPSANRMQLEYSALPLMTKLPLEKVKSAQPSGA